jgi:hypothetical protein
LKNVCGYYASYLAYIAAVELSVSVTFPSVAVMFDDIGSVVEPISPSGVVGAWAIAADVKVPAIKEAVARILAIANKYILFMRLY